MELAQIVMWLVGIQTTLFLAALGFVWSNLSRKMLEMKVDLSKKDDELATSIKSTRDELVASIKSTDSKVESLNHICSDLDKRLYGIEAVLHMKDCCVLKQDQSLKRAE